MADKFAIVSELNGFALDVEHGSKEDGARLIAIPFNGAANQLFTFKCNGEIECLHSQGVLTVGGGTAKGNPIVQNPPCEFANQVWRIYHDGTIRLKKCGIMCIDICKSNKEHGASVIAWPHHGGANQRWRLVNQTQ